MTNLSSDELIERHHLNATDSNSLRRAACQHLRELCHYAGGGSWIDAAPYEVAERLIIQMTPETLRAYEEFILSCLSEGVRRLILDSR